MFEAASSRVSFYLIMPCRTSPIHEANDGGLRISRAGSAATDSHAPERVMPHLLVVLAGKASEASREKPGARRESWRVKGGGGVPLEKQQL